jgi:hypothetical protein
MKDRRDFDISLLEGEVAEIRLKQLFGNKTIEVKRDFETFRTGNIAIEYMSRGKPSGLSVTKADWWAFVMSGDLNDEVILLMKTSRLKLLAKKHWKDNRKAGGDNNTSKLVLIPFAEVIK